MSASDPYASANRPSRRPLEGQEGARASPSASPAVGATAVPAASAAAAKPASKAACGAKVMTDEERKRQAEAVAEEARACAERERRLAERSDEVCQVAARLIAFAAWLW